MALVLSHEHKILPNNVFPPKVDVLPHLILHPGGAFGPRNTLLRINGLVNALLLGGGGAWLGIISLDVARFGGS